MLAMGRSRYVITEPDAPHFLTCTVVEWLPIFTRPEAVGILLNSWTYLREHGGRRGANPIALSNPR
jgi:putative transposase